MMVQGLQEALFLLSTLQSSSFGKEIAVPLICCSSDTIFVPSKKQVVLLGSWSSLAINDMLSAAY
ncbi:unnamed protein product [Brassica napus]|uniref:(rape) hypothetical protein n=1 Tax=Brassica napus TaxID=3708 RepID=A0A816I3G1_BRANA|nr:unnamed protein product [Brassica napus]